MESLELTGFFAVIIGSTGLFKLANDAAHANMEVSKLFSQLGMATASITGWQNVAVRKAWQRRRINAILLTLIKVVNSFFIKSEKITPVIACMKSSKTPNKKKRQPVYLQKEI